MESEPTKNKAAIIAVVFLLLLTPISFLAARNFRSQFSRAASTPLTTPEVSSGSLGYAAKFDNPTITLHSYAYSSPSANLRYNNPSTVEMWFKAYAIQADSYPAPLFIRSSGDGIYFTQTTAGAPVELAYMLPNGTGSVSTTPIQYEKWYHVALVTDGSLVRFYINGNLEFQQKDDVIASMPDAATIYLGRTWGSELNGAGQRGFNGEIDELRVSSMARYSTNFAPQATPFSPDTATLLLLHFENSLTDSSFNSNLINSVNMQYILNSNIQTTPMIPSITPTAYINMPSPTSTIYYPSPTTLFPSPYPTMTRFPTPTVTYPTPTQAYKTMTQTWQINTKTDDVEDTGNNCSITGFVANLGDYRGIGSNVGFRFNGITIPRNAQIISAKLEVKNRENTLGGDGGKFVVSAQDTYNAPSLNCSTNSPRIVATTLNKVIWAAPEYWYKDGWYSSPDIKTIVQEIVNKSGWTNNNSLSIIVRDDPTVRGFRKIYMYDWGKQSGAKLTITWAQ
jgi:hypothetical protein